MSGRCRNGYCWSGQQASRRICATRRCTIAEYGPQTSTEQVASYVGVRPPGHPYFGGAADLHHSIARRASDMLIAAQRPVWTGTGRPIETDSPRRVEHLRPPKPPAFVRSIRPTAKRCRQLLRCHSRVRERRRRKRDEGAFGQSGWGEVPVLVTEVPYPRLRRIGHHPRGEQLRTRAAEGSHRRTIRRMDRPRHRNPAGSALTRKGRYPFLERHVIRLQPAQGRHANRGAAARLPAARCRGSADGWTPTPLGRRNDRGRPTASCRPGAPPVPGEHTANGNCGIGVKILNYAPCSRNSAECDAHGANRVQAEDLPDC